MRRAFRLRLFAIAFLVVLTACNAAATPSPTEPLPPTIQLTPTPQITASTVTSVPAPTPSSNLGVGSTKTRTTDGMVMVYVPAGSFKMGSDTGDSDEKPVHDVTLDAFWIDRTEVTNVMFEKFVVDTGYETDAEKQGSGWAFDAAKQEWSEVQGANWQHPRGPASDLKGRDDHPVIQVSWNDANAYCKWTGGLLPTEAQWEYAARGSQDYTYPWGNDPPNDTLLNYNRKIGDTTKVGTYPPGASWVGALDLAGNVWEWVQDWYGPYSSSTQTNPTGPTSGTDRVLRGGSWDLNASYVPAAIRHFVPQDIRVGAVGFRCVVSPGG